MPPVQFDISEELIFDLADLFKVFSDSTRLKILCALSGKEMNVTELSAAVGASQTAVSHQLSILRQNHLAKYRRDGKQMVYSLADEHVQTIISCGIEHIEE
ncbi:MAG: metalloregulator ArsR/SmtB family transcription factor [Clostridiales bacterium]|nr:metalloregulator ArsR/SmtB family transcription factor [Clostridiales bacterium]